MRIAFCLPELAPKQAATGQRTNAAHIQQEYIASGLRSRGYDLTCCRPRNLEEVFCVKTLGDPAVVARTWSASRWFQIARRATWRVQQWLGVPYLNVFSNYCYYDSYLQCLPGHDLVHERQSLYRVGVAMACRRLRLPYVLFFDADEIMEHDYMGESLTGLLRWRAKSIVAYNLRAADCVICVSEASRDRLVNFWNTASEKIVVFPNGVDVERFRPFPESRSAVRASLGLETNPIFIFVGNFYAWHDVTTLLDAFARVLPVHPDARLVLVGDGSQHKSMVRHAADIGISDAVRFTGSVPHADVPRLIDAADVAIAPYPAMSHDLWFSPMKLFEYMASGKAVVASSVGQLAGVIQDNHNGMLVPPGDILSTAAAMQRLIEDTPLRVRLGRQAREDAMVKYSWDCYLSRLDRLYAAVIERRPVYGI